LENKLTAVFLPGRQIASAPEKILDAPDMINDFYLHLMDWSSLNHMAVALSAGVFIWNATDGTILQLCQREVEEEYVASVSWIKVTTFCSFCSFLVKINWRKSA
jgi:cell division cycle protein 20 (cofactor of APC complex)